MPYGDRVASDRRQNIVLVNQPMTDEISYPIVVAAHAMKRAFCAFSPPERAKLLPGRARQNEQQEKLVVLKLRALPYLEQMRGDGKIAFARGLTQLQDHHDGARDERDGRDDRRDRGRGFPVDR